MTVNASLPFFISSLELAQWHIVPGVDCIVKGFHKMAFFFVVTFSKVFCQNTMAFLFVCIFLGGGWLLSREDAHFYWIFSLECDIKQNKK